MNILNPTEMLEIPRLSIGERDRRWSKIREKMRQECYDCLLIWGYPGHWDFKIANARYVSGIGGNGEFSLIIFPLEGEPTCFIWANTFLEFWKRATNWIQDIRHRNPSWAKSAAQRLEELGLTNSRIGIVGTQGLFDRDGWMPSGIYQSIINELPNVTWGEATHLLEEVRMIKSEEEIEMLRKAVLIGDKMMQTLVDTAKPGVVEHEVYANVMHELLRHGGEQPTLFLWSAGKDPAVHPGMFPENRRLEKGDIIITEYHSKYAGYHGHHERTISLGRPEKRRKELYEIGLECYQATMEGLKPGVHLNDVQHIIRRPLVKHGVAYVECGIHGHGLESLEYPSFVFPPNNAADELVQPQTIIGSGLLEEGMVFGLIVDVIDPNWKNGKTGIVFAETLIIGRNGPERLSNSPLEMPIVNC